MPRPRSSRSFVGPDSHWTCCQPARPGGNVTDLTAMDWGHLWRARRGTQAGGTEIVESRICCSTVETSPYTRGSSWAQGIETKVSSLGVEVFIVETDPACEAANRLRGCRPGTALVGAS